MSFNLGGFLFGNVGSDGEVEGEMGDVSQAMAMIGNMNDQLGINIADMEKEPSDSEAVAPDESAVDYDDIDEVIDDAGETKSKDSTPPVTSLLADDHDYDAETEETETRKKTTERPKPVPSDIVTKIFPESPLIPDKQSFTVKRKKKSSLRSKARRKAEENTRKAPALNLKLMFGGRTTLTPELRRYCCTLRGEDGPILKYTEIFASPDAPPSRSKRVGLRRDSTADIVQDSIEVFPELDENEHFETGEAVQQESVNESVKKCKSPPIFSVADLLESSSDDSMSDGVSSSDSGTDIEDTVTTHDEEIHGPLYPTSGGMYDCIPSQDKNSRQLIATSITPRFNGLEQDLWEDKIHWGDSDVDMEEENETKDEEKEEKEKEEQDNEFIEALKQMNLWPPKQPALDVTNEVEIELPKKRGYVEAIGDSSSEEDDEILVGTPSSTNIFSPGNTNMSNVIGQSHNNLTISTNQTPVQKKTKANAFDEVTKYTLPYRNEYLDSGEWIKDIIWDDSTIRTNENYKPPSILFDLNDKHMLYEDDVISVLQPKEEDSDDEKEQPPKEQVKEESKDIKTENQDEEPPEELDPFNLSLDNLYIKRKSLRRKKIRKAKIYHSPVALKLSMVRPYLSKEALEYFHKPRTTTIPHSFPRKISTCKAIPQPPKLSSTATDSNLFKKKSDLSSCDGDLILLEYIEKRPLALMNIGMASKFCNYTRTKKGEGEDNDSDNENENENENEFETGETVALEPTDDSPFLGDVLPGQTVRSFDNNLFRVPLAQHKAPPTDFLLIKSKDNQKLTLRPLPEIYCCGQIQPIKEVPAPNSRAANVFRKNRLQAFIYRFFKRKSKKYPQRLRIADVCAAFPWHSDANVRKYLKHVADFQRGGDDSGWWTLKPNLELPTEEQLQSMTEPEDLCLFESMRVGLNHLQNLGIEHMTKSNGIQTALESTEIHDKEMLAKIRRVEDELNLTPWNLTTNFIRAAQGRSMLQLTGLGAPLKGNCSFSYINLPLKVQQSKQKQKQANIPKSAVTGTDADLRKLSLEDARITLLKFGLSEEEIAGMKRWVRIDKVRQLSSAAAKAQGGQEVSKFARGTRHSTEQQKQEYKAKAQKIFENQLNFISKTDIEEDSESESSESDSDDDLFASVMNSMDTKQEEPRPATVEVPQINTTPRPENPPPGTKWIKKVTRIPNHDGTITLRTEIIRDVDKVEDLLKKMKQSRQPNVKAHASAEEEQLKSKKRRERRRLQERLRRLKKNAEKQKTLQERLINGEEDNLPQTTSVSLKCGACGMPGHMRTNRTCPVFSEPKAKPISQVKGTTKIRISTQALTENEGDEKLTISIPKKVIEEADRLDEPTRRPKKVQRGRRTKEQLQIALNNVLFKVVEAVKHDAASVVFRWAVNEREGAPGYYDIVKQPMHLHAIGVKCRNGDYTSVSDMMSDVDLIVSNCYLYNKDRNIHLLPVADRLKELVLETLDQHKEEISEIEQTALELENTGSLNSSTASQ